MRIVRFVGEDGSPLCGSAREDGSAEILDQAMKPTGGRVRIGRLLAPVVPSQIICIGRNYRPTDFAALPADALDADKLEVFMKPLGTVIGPGGAIRLPQFGGLDPQTIAEGELAVVIGPPVVTHVNEDESHRHVLGYTATNDVTAMRWQTPAGTPLWMRGKGFDTFCPLGPAIVTVDEVPDPSALTIRTFVNGRLVRQGSAGAMMRSVPRIISELSAHITLARGTVILTGGPPLVDGQAILDAKLKPGDEVVIEIDRIGRLVNSVQSA